MKVKQLIHELSKFNPEANVTLHTCNGDNALFVLSLKNSPLSVWIEGNADTDLKSQLQLFEEQVNQENWEEQDVYAELVNKGITAKDIQMCFGEERAKHFVERCTYYGLS